MSAQAGSLDYEEFQRHRGVTLQMPRVLDIFLSCVAMVVLLPLLLLIAAANYLLTGTVLFRQVRLGQGLRPFVIVKFQTMIPGAESGSTVAVAGDSRTTRFGQFLRSTKLDELPQLLNVLRGEMGLVGPRALPPGEVARMIPDVALQVYTVRPGLTGLASLMLTDEGRLLATTPDPEEYYFREILPQKAAWELIYVQRRNLWFDMLVLLSTPAAIVFPHAVRRLFCRVLGQTSLPSLS